MGQIKSELSARLGTDFTMHVTERPLQSTESTREQIRNGATLVIAVGGDGTVHETVNGFFEDKNLINPDCQLGVLSLGTGSDFIRSLGMTKDFKDQMTCIQNGKSRLIDIGTVLCTSENGEVTSQYFANECQVGMGGAVVAGVGSAHKAFGGRLAFGSVALISALKYRPQLMTVSIDDEDVINRSLLGIATGNGSYCGGGMRLTPEAQLDDGWLDVLTLEDMTRVRLLMTFPQIYRGSHIHTPYCTYQRGRKIVVTTAEPALVAADGELLGFTPCTIELIPSILPVRCSL